MRRMRMRCTLPLSANTWKQTTTKNHTKNTAKKIPGSIPKNGTKNMRGLRHRRDNQQRNRSFCRAKRAPSVRAANRARNSPGIPHASAGTRGRDSSGRSAAAAEGATGIAGGVEIVTVEAAAGVQTGAADAEDSNGVRAKGNREDNADIAGTAAHRGGLN